MEAWKWLNYSSESPVYSLSLTTTRWGLEGFPGNLVATTGWLNNIRKSVIVNKSAEVRIYTLPYTCPGYMVNGHSFDASLQNYNNEYKRQYPYLVTNSLDVTSTDICETPCADSRCVILIEGIGSTRTGLSQTDIVALSHGLSFFFSLGFTIVIIMSFLRFKKRSTVSKPAPPPGYTAPFQPTGKKYAEEVAEQARSAKEIKACADLLRELYSLDLAIWGQENSVDPSSRQRDMFRANALFIEICRIVQSWQMDEKRWSSGEKRHIEEMASFLDRHDRKRYEV
jgi:hypothetical protein